MKIKPEDYQALAVALSKHNLAEAYYQYEQKGLSPERFRWDMLHFSGFDTRPLYSYLNDSHIDTALKRIVWEAIRI